MTSMASPAECLDRFSCFVTHLSRYHYPAFFSAESILSRDGRLPYTSLRSIVRSPIIILLVMPGEQYCEPCKRLLCGKAQPYSENAWRIDFTHHSDANSFKEALGLPCFVCSFAWNEKECSLSWQESISYGTAGQLFVRDGDDVIVLRFSYDYPKRSSKSISLVPCEGMFLK